MITTAYKGRSGWQAESTTESDANGNAWQISTHKSRSGVSCSAVQGQLSRGMFSYDMFGSKKLQLASTDGMCNEKKVRETHAAGLIEFERIIAETEPATPAYIIEVGQIIFTEFQQGRTDDRVIYEIVSAGDYKTVSLDGKSLSFDDRMRPYTEKFGIGVYYNEGEKMPADELRILLEAAQTWAEITEYTTAQESTKAAAERAEKLEAGRAVISAKPTNYQSVIVAELRQNDSDLQTDYIAYSTQKVVYLAWSRHNRDLFAEMRTAAEKFEPTRIYEVAPATDENETPADENREKYSGGSGYYLGESKYSGWIVRKTKLDYITLEELQIAAAEGRFLCSELEAVPTVAAELTGSVQIIEHPKKERKILVTGETYKLKGGLKELGGWWNKWEKGWEFNAEALGSITQFLTSKTA